MTTGVIAPLPHRVSHLQAVHLYIDGGIWGRGLNHLPRHWFTLTVLNLLLPGGELYSLSHTLTHAHATWFLTRSAGDLHPAIFPLHTTWSQNWNSIWLHVFTVDCLLGYWHSGFSSMCCEVISFSFFLYICKTVNYLLVYFNFCIKSIQINIKM